MPEPPGTRMKYPSRNGGRESIFREAARKHRCNLISGVVHLVNFSIPVPEGGLKDEPIALVAIFEQYDCILQDYPVLPTFEIHFEVR